MSRGRPTDYTPKLAKEICDKIATHGDGIRTICKANPDFPNPDTIYAWLRKYKEFSELYARAKKEQVHALVEDILEISDDSSNDICEDENGNMRFNSEFTARSRLRVDTRKWIAAKLVPRLYGDNIIARELSDEIEELKKLLKEKNHGQTNNEETK